MSKRMFPAVMGVALSLSMVAPSFSMFVPQVLAAEPSLVAQCRDAFAPEYRSTLVDLGQDLRDNFTDQWNRQIGFRVRAARQNRKTAVQRALQITGRTLSPSLDQLISGQTRAVDADITALVAVYNRSNTLPTSAQLGRGPGALSFGAMNSSFLRLERALRLYASFTDRAIISRVWNETRQESQRAFQEGRDEARMMFIESMNACIYEGMSPEEILEELDLSKEEEEEEKDGAESVMEKEEVKEEPKREAATNTPAPTPNADPAEATRRRETVAPRAPEVVRITRINIENEVLQKDTCKQHVILRANVFASGKSLIKGYFLFQDGVRSPDMTLETDITGQAYAEFRREFAPTAASSGNGSGQFVVVAPEPFSSAKTEFAIRCVSAQSAAAAPKADVQLSVVDKSEVQACSQNYRFQFAGTISYGGAGTVQYYWLRSDGSRSAMQSLVFERAGSKAVTYEWYISASMSGSVSLVVVSPNAIRAQADWRFIRECTSPSAASPSADASKDSDAASASPDASASGAASGSAADVSKVDDSAATSPAASSGSATDVKEDEK